MRYTALFFSPTGGVRRACSMLAEGIADGFEYIDFSLTLSGRDSVAFSREDVCVIAAPSFGGRVPEVALDRLAQVRGGGARAVLLSIYGNRDDVDALYDLRDAARSSGFVPIAAVRAIAEHSIVRSIAQGRPDEADKRTLHAFGREIRTLLDAGSREEADIPEKAMLRPFGGVPLHPKTGKRCTRCGKCATLCPVGAIPRDDPAMTDESVCITCMRCVAVCPEQARALNPLLLRLASRKLRRVCAQRREPEIILPPRKK